MRSSHHNRGFAGLVTIGLIGALSVAGCSNRSREPGDWSLQDEAAENVFCRDLLTAIGRDSPDQIRIYCDCY